jgi:DNA-nicking Smr family endonuclease
MNVRPKKTAAAVSAEDLLLFQDAVGKVRRLQREATALQRPQPAPEPVQSLLDEARVPAELLRSAIDPGTMEIGEELSYLKDGFSPRLLRRLKRGQFSIADEIDLHVMNSEVARAAVKSFLDEARREGRLCVKIIHGKGLRSRSQPVLKRLVDGLLRRRDDVLAFASAPPAQGGTGAVLVLLRRR